MRVKAAAVTGATGFIGRHLVERLAALGWQVRVIQRPESRAAAPAGIEAVRAPLRADGLAAAFEGTGVVFHLAGRTAAPSAAAFHQANAVAAGEVARACRDAGARLVHVSSQAAAGPAPANRPATEAGEARPCSAYGISKLAGERIVQDTVGLEWTIARPVAVYGPGDRGFLPLFRLARAGFAVIPGSPAACYTLVHVRDLVEGLIAAAERPEAVREVFFLGHPVLRTARSLAAALGRVAGRPVRTITVPRPVLYAAAVAGDLGARLGLPAALDRSKYRELTSSGFACEVGKARRLLQWEAGIDLEEGFAETVTWYLENGWLR
ncbi:MAG TPA: NAD-dependent epimerase/dehydratase family protein [Vicinamibacterales bacterium]|nr:NAD-dependent epimerase/dehydratase family protein [Acidobacteriota bacterium]HOC19236.1 NAD-dependent epimerase/dehydratase family protein [Vicinamibacterales bacterium]